ncbi:AraC family transcriptional regulator [Aquimarina sp. 2201CG5-10]|uniref:helix-turn-helix domain-containing protein n=1 Tax=Aquimarina callyspongiae TaxID=3098150 RepID=UPI002AB52CB8|nr:AraC family transcriptional regulator [Aquimarina sp. 2201CG5-10]MDY8135887.1 AraC family transcriptional regulator [Aquimarina sp. 2201CG5-10]
MVNKIKAEINKVYFIDQHTLVHILQGTGNIQIDFKNYYDWKDRAIYLSKGQYIKFMSDDFVVQFFDFAPDTISKSEDSRVLFKHLISFGYINLNSLETNHLFLQYRMDEIIKTSVKRWYDQNPFRATKDEYKAIFDVKDAIDNEFSYKTNNTKSLIAHLKYEQSNVSNLIKKKVKTSISKMILKKGLLECQRELAFTNKNIQEIAYEKGYKDPAYFNRIFKNKIGVTPRKFRYNFDYKDRDLFFQDILALIKQFHKTEHNICFYAEKMNLCSKNLSQKVKQKTGITLGQLIRFHIIKSAKELLLEGENVINVSYALGFTEPSHFSRFFTSYTGTSPSSYKNS